MGDRVLSGKGDGLSEASERESARSSGGGGGGSGVGDEGLAQDSEDVL